jgi:hypothetical protein
MDFRSLVYACSSAQKKIGVGAAATRAGATAAGGAVLATGGAGAYVTGGDV